MGQKAKWRPADKKKNMTEQPVSACLCDPCHLLRMGGAPNSRRRLGDHAATLLINLHKAHLLALSYRFVGSIVLLSRAPFEKTIEAWCYLPTLGEVVGKVTMGSPNPGCNPIHLWLLGVWAILSFSYHPLTEAHGKGDPACCYLEHSSARNPHVSRPGISAVSHPSSI